MNGPKMIGVATQLREIGTNRSVRAERRRRDRLVPLVSFVINALFGIVYLLLGSRLVTQGLTTESGGTVVSFMGSVTEPFVAPFVWMVPGQTAVAGASSVMVVLVALIASLILHGILNRLLVRRAYSRKPGIQRFNVGRHA
jgi:hypothetical protein